MSALGCIIRQIQFGRKPGAFVLSEWLYKTGRERQKQRDPMLIEYVALWHFRNCFTQLWEREREREREREPFTLEENMVQWYFQHGLAQHYDSFTHHLSSPYSPIWRETHENQKFSPVIQMSSLAMQDNCGQSVGYSCKQWPSLAQFTHSWIICKGRRAEIRSS